MPNKPPRGTEHVDWVSASEVGSAAYCERMLWLTKVQHLRPDAAGQARLKAGTERHHEHGVKVDTERRVKQAALLVLAGTMLVAFLLWLFLRFGGVR